MGFKEKVIGIILIIIGVLPFLLKIDALNNAIGKYTWMLPGAILYQGVLIILGILLLFRFRTQVERNK